MLIKTKIICFVVFTLIALSSSVNISSVKSVVVIAETEDQISVISKTGAEHRVYFWKRAYKRGDGFIGIIDQNNKKHNKFLKTLDKKQINYGLHSIDDLLAKIKKLISRKPSVRGMAYDYNNRFYRYDEIHSELDRIAADHSNKYLKAKVVTIGQTFEKKPIKGIQISKEGDYLGTVVIECGIHAREWSSVSACMWTINQLLNKLNYPKVTSFDFIIIPVLNVDGYAYTWSETITESIPSSRMWRKSRHVVKNAYPNPRYPWANCTGTDLNRNFETSSWCKLGSPNDFHQCAKDESCGAHPFSAPETAALRDFLTPIKDQIVIYFSIHAFGALWIYPPFYKREPIPETQEWDIISKAAVDSIKSVNGIQYKYGNAFSVLYKSEGVSVDWAHQKLKVKYVFTIEVGPIGKGIKDFPGTRNQQFDAYVKYFVDGFVSEDKIGVTGAEVWAGIETAIVMIGHLNYTRPLRPTETKRPDNKSTDIVAYINWISRFIVYRINCSI